MVFCPAVPSRIPWLQLHSSPPSRCSLLFRFPPFSRSPRWYLSVEFCPWCGSPAACFHYLPCPGFLHSISRRYLPRFSLGPSFRRILISLPSSLLFCYNIVIEQHNLLWLLGRRCFWDIAAFRLLAFFVKHFVCLCHTPSLALVPFPAYAVLRCALGP